MQIFLDKAKTSYILIERLTYGKKFKFKFTMKTATEEITKNITESQATYLREFFKEALK